MLLHSSNGTVLEAGRHYNIGVLAMRRSLALEVLQVVLLAALVFFGVRTLFDNFVVQGASMEPSLSSGEYLIVNKAVYLRSSWVEKLNPFGDAGDGNYVFHPPRRGDVIVLHAPVARAAPLYIKRVIGVPGDTVEVRQGKVIVNGEALDEPYILEPPRRDFARRVVPPGHVFVLGDNRNNSEDSTVFGMLPEDNILGKAWVKYWPPRDWGWVPNATLAAGLPQ